MEFTSKEIRIIMKLNKYIIACSLILSACSVVKAIADLDNFDITIKEQTVIAGGGLVSDILGEVGFTGLNSFDIEDNQEFQNKDIPKKNIEWTRVRDLDLTVIDPDSNTFAFVDSILFFIQSPNQERAALASSGAVADTLQIINFNLENLDIAPYLKDESMSITTQFFGTQPSENTTVEIEMKLEIEAKL